MKTDDLITILSQSPLPRPPLPLAIVLAALMAASMMATYMVLGFRPDIDGFFSNPAALTKASLLSVLLLAAYFMLRDAARPLPAGKIKICAWLLLGLFGGAAGMEWLQERPEVILELLTRPNFRICLISVGIYGTVGAVVLTLLLRRYAPADPGRAAFLTGFAAASAGALGYSFHCPLDSPTFITVAYGTPVLLISLAARALAPRFIRW